MTETGMTTLATKIKFTLPILRNHMISYEISYESTAHSLSAVDIKQQEQCVLRICLRITINSMKCHDKRCLERKWFIHLILTHHSSLSKQVRTWTQTQIGSWRQELLRRPWMGTIDWLYMVCWPCSLIEPRSTRPGRASPTMGWSFPHQSLIKKIVNRLVYSLILGKHFLK